MPKIICVGHQKSGTTSIAHALGLLGYNVGNPHLALRAEMDWSVADPYPQLRDITLATLAENDAIEDTPCAHFHKELDAAFPGSKFILTRRKSDRWLKSFRNFFGNEFNSVRKWMYGVEQLNGNEAAIIAVYERKNNEIIDYFKDRPDDFLILDLEEGDGWLKLVNFLGEDFLKPFPHANKAGTGWNSKIMRRWRNRLLRAFYLVVIGVLLVVWLNS